MNSGSNLNLNLLNPVQEVRGSGSPICWTEPDSQGLGSAKKCPNPNRTRLRPVYTGGKYRLLLVDGHNSHYTHGFLEYACMHQILVVCYPVHTTHVLQGLDVVIFGVLKHFWTIERNWHERETGGKVDKTNFLGIYGRDHLRTMNTNTICAAF